MAIKVDLLPTERKKFGFDIVLAIIIILIAIAAVGFWSYGEQLQRNLADKESTLTSKNAEVEKEKADLPQIDEMKKRNENIRAQIRTVSTLRNDPVRYSNLLDEISRLLPYNMWVSKIDIDPVKQVVQLAGLAVEQPGVRPLESISGFMKSLSQGNSECFLSSTISSTTRGTTTVGKSTYTSYGWTIEAAYDPVKAEGRHNLPPEKEDNSGSQSSTDKGRS